MNCENKLPNLPSDLLRLAVDDLTRVEADSRYRVDMGFWHKPTTSPDNGGVVCGVCLAGAVMAKSLEAEINVSASPVNADDKTYNQLEALNSFRAGHYVSAVHKLNYARCIDNETFYKLTKLLQKEFYSGPESDRIKARDYRSDPVAFKQRLLDLADLFESWGA